MKEISNFKELYINEADFKVKFDKSYLITLAGVALYIPKKMCKYAEAQKQDSTKLKYSVTINNNWDYKVFNFTGEGDDIKLDKASERVVTGKDLINKYWELKRQGSNL